MKALNVTDSNRTHAVLAEHSQRDTRQGCFNYLTAKMLIENCKVCKWTLNKTTTAFILHEIMATVFNLILGKINKLPEPFRGQILFASLPFRSNIAFTLFKLFSYKRSNAN